MIQDGLLAFRLEIDLKFYDWSRNGIKDTITIMMNTEELLFSTKEMVNLLYMKDFNAALWPSLPESFQSLMYKFEGLKRNAFRTISIGSTEYIEVPKQVLKKQHEPGIGKRKKKQCLAAHQQATLTVCLLGPEGIKRMESVANIKKAQKKMRKQRYVSYTCS